MRTFSAQSHLMFDQSSLNWFPLRNHGWFPPLWVYIPKIVWWPISVGGLDFEYACSPCQTFLCGGGPKILEKSFKVHISVNNKLQKKIWTYSTTTFGNFLALFYRTTWVIEFIRYKASIGWQGPDCCNFRECLFWYNHNSWWHIRP